MSVKTEILFHEEVYLRKIERENERQTEDRERLPFLVGYLLVGWLFDWLVWTSYPNSLWRMYRVWVPQCYTCTHKWSFITSHKLGIIKCLNELTLENEKKSCRQVCVESRLRPYIICELFINKFFTYLRFI